MDTMRCIFYEGPDTYPIVCIVFDDVGNSATATRTVTVVDTMPPSLMRVGASSVTVECGDPYTDAWATATDYCDGDVSAGQDHITVVGPITAHGTLVEKPQLSWDMKSMDGSATQAELGYIKVSPDKAYYPAATPYNQSCLLGQGCFDGPNQLVKLTVETHCGYEFVRWTGKGDVYDSQGNPLPNVSLEATDEEPEKWVTSESIWIKMARKGASTKSAWYEWWPFGPELEVSTRITKPDTQVIAFEAHYDLPKDGWENGPRESVEHRGDIIKHTFSNSEFPNLSFKGVKVTETVVGVPEETTADLTQEQWLNLTSNSQASINLKPDSSLSDEHALFPDDRFEDGNTITLRQKWYLDGQENDPINPGFIKIIYKCVELDGQKHFFVKKVYDGMWVACPDYPEDL